MASPPTETFFSSSTKSQNFSDILHLRYRPSPFLDGLHRKGVKVETHSGKTHWEKKTFWDEEIKNSAAEMVWEKGDENGCTENIMDWCTVWKKKGKTLKNYLRFYLIVVMIIQSICLIDHVFTADRMWFDQQDVSFEFRFNSAPAPPANPSLGIQFHL